MLDVLEQVIGEARMIGKCLEKLPAFLGAQEFGALDKAIHQQGRAAVNSREQVQEEVQVANGMVNVPPRGQGAPHT